MNYPLFDKINASIGLAIALLSHILGDHWFLFFAFLLLNVVDYVTGCMKSTINNKTNSVKGAVGALKKLGYWLMILVAFSAGAIFMEIGDVIGVNLGVTSLVGWFVLTTLIINELRSIIENFVEAGFKVPEILTKGLEVANKVVETASSSTNDEGNSDDLKHKL